MWFLFVSLYQCSLLTDSENESWSFTRSIIRKDPNKWCWSIQGALSSIAPEIVSYNVKKFMILSAFDHPLETNQIHWTSSRCTFNQVPILNLHLIHWTRMANVLILEELQSSRGKRPWVSSGRWGFVSSCAARGESKGCNCEGVSLTRQPTCATATRVLWREAMGRLLLSAEYLGPWRKS